MKNPHRIVKMEDKDTEFCDCPNCLDSETPCLIEGGFLEPRCDREEPCAGCREARAERDDVRFEIDLAQGRYTKGGSK